MPRRRVVRTAIVACVLVGGLLIAPRSSLAATITLSAVGFGSAFNNGDLGPQFNPDVFIGVSPVFLATGQGTDQYRYRTILEFPLAALNPGAIVTSATFSVTESSGTAVVGSAWRRFGYAADGLATLSDADFTGDAALPDLIVSGTPGATYSVDVTALITSLLLGSQSFAGFLIADNPSDPGSFGFTNYVLPGGGAGAPVLSITYDLQSEQDPAPVPEPGSLALLGIGLASLAGARSVFR